MLAAAVPNLPRLTMGPDHATIKPEPAAIGTAPRATLPDSAEEALRRVFELAIEQIDREDRLPASGLETPESLRERLGLALGSDGLTMGAVVGKLRRVLAATPSSASPSFLNQLFGGRDPVATLAEMLTPLLNTSMYTYKVAGPQVLIEQEVIGRMAHKVGYADGEGILCPGGTLSNLVAMLIARNESSPSLRDHGSSGERLTAYTSSAGHYSTRKNAGILGLGRRNVRAISTDGRGRMAVAELKRAIEKDRAAGRQPFFINATAGTTVLGAFDPLPAIARIAREQNLWLHVDGALGGSVLLCTAERSLLDGAELSDSFTWNAHKLMGVPLSCSAVLLRRSDLLQKHLSETADYLFQAHGDELNPGTRSLQCGRRNDALKLWAAWQLHGDRGYDRRLRHLFDLARYAARQIEADPQLELTQWPQSINVCFEVPGTRSDAICDHLERQGRLLIGFGTVAGRQAIRLAVVNTDLHESDIDSALAEVKQAAAEAAHGPAPPAE